MSDMCRFRSKKPPPLHTGADWKVVLHLPEIETWLRVTSDRVTQLTHSVGQDSDNRHVDVHLVQLKVDSDTSSLVFGQLSLLFVDLVQPCAKSEVFTVLVLFFNTHLMQITKSLRSSGLF